MDEENKDVFGSIMQTYLQGVYHLLELTQPDLAPDWVREQAVESTPRPTISSRAQFTVVCHALVLFAQAVLRDIRHWVAKQLLTWALRQLDDTDLWGQATEATEQHGVFVLEPPYHVVNDTPVPAVPNEQLSLW